ncbi:hexose kinase [Nocardioides sp. CER19]|uniref:1-phosphofructokinase family hexose kinase n=1 Tax=Nocardioides sp. CER19 TaxID=3038538 RepID=UPI00244B5AF5|nr:hexose kinase [Nocardioides sp. CER19]MDH2414078.1 hexose kinase [Nocardioides sp. CER19]
MTTPVIVTVTCNPALDVTYDVDALRPGEVHRVRAVHERPGGKGVNVARVLTRLGVPALATGLDDGSFGALVADSGVPAAFVPALGRVRRTLVISAGATTSLWEPGPPVAAGAADALVEHVAGLLGGAGALVVSGSLPRGLDADLPARLADVAQHAGVPAVLDLDEAPLARALVSGGAVLTPNVDELHRLLGRPAADLPAAARSLAARNHAPVVLTLGPRGVLASDGDHWWHAATEPVSGNPTGAGDSVTAALARGLAAGTPWRRLVADAACLGAAAVVTPVAGEIDLPTYERLLASVLVTTDPEEIP